MPPDDDDASFAPGLFAFLDELARNNDRTWFQANKARYEAEVKEPALAFVEDMGHRLPDVAPELVADQKSLFRIHRDTRFSKDKSPYKTHTGIYFRHASAARIELPGLYLHLEPGHVFLGAGIWHPDTAALKRLRDAIVARPDDWVAARDGGAPDWTIADGEALVRPPKGYPADHALVADLKRKSFAVISPQTEAEATSGGFLDLVTERARTARPFLSWTCDALGAAY